MRFSGASFQLLVEPRVSKKQIENSFPGAMMIEVPSSVAEVLPIMGHWVWDAKSNVIFGDVSTANYFNLSNEEAAAGAPISRYLDAVHPDDAGTFAAKFTDTNVDDPACFSTYRVRGRDRKEHTVVASGHYFSNDNGTAYFAGTVLAPDQIINHTKSALETLADASLLAHAAATADNRDFIVYLLNMVLHEVAFALAKSENSDGAAQPIRD